MNPRFTVIVPIYNAERTLDYCISSIKKQSVQDFECLLIDDGSIDNSKSICEKTVNSDIRFKYIYKNNSGPGETRNLGIRTAKGEWLTFCDSDDWLESNRLEYAYDTAQRYNVQIVWNAMNIWQNDRIINIWHSNIPGLYKTDNKLILSNKKYDIGHAPNKLYKTSLLQDNQIFFPNIKMSEDLIFNIEAFYTAGTILNINKPLYNYIRHDNSISLTYDSKTSFINLYCEFMKLCKKMKLNNDFNANKPIIERFIKNVIHLN